MALNTYYDTYRDVYGADDVAPPPTITRFAPDAILAISGLTGAVTVIQDDPDDPDGSWLVA
jgi:hypothetical protein